MLPFNFIAGMTHRTYCNHSLANYQYVKSTAVTLGASRAAGSRAQCAGRLIIKTAVDQIDVVPLSSLAAEEPDIP